MILSSTINHLDGCALYFYFPQHRGVSKGVKANSTFKANFTFPTFGENAYGFGVICISSCSIRAIHAKKKIVWACVFDELCIS